MKLLIAATPKTGNHWLSKLLYEIYRIPSPERFEDRHNLREWLVQEHFKPEAPTLAWVRAEDVTPITIVRHPMDVLVSLYHHIWMKKDGEVRPEERCILRDKGAIGAGTLEYARTAFYPLLMISDMWRFHGAPFVRYEDLQSDPLTTLRRLTQRIKPVPDETIRQAIMFSHFSLMQRDYEPFVEMKSEHNFYRRGGTGYSDELTPELIALFSTAPFADYMRDLGYDLNMEPVARFDPNIFDPFRGNRTFSNGVPITRTFHKFLIQIPDLTARWPTPWDASTPDSLYSWLNEIDPRNNCTNLMMRIYSQRPDLQEISPSLRDAPREFYLWFLGNASHEYEVGPEFLAPARSLLCKYETQRGTAAAR